MASADIDLAVASDEASRASNLLALREGQWFDRKSLRITPRKLSEAIVGFANAEGGTIIIGLSDGRVEDLSTLSQREHNALLQTAMRLCDPPVRTRQSELACVDEQGNRRRLISIEVLASEDLHETSRGECFLRLGDSTIKQDSSQIQELRFDKGNQKFEATRVPDATNDDIDQHLLTNYANRLSHDQPQILLEDRTGTRATRIGAWPPFCCSGRSPPGSSPTLSSASSASRAGSEQSARNRRLPSMSGSKPLSRTRSTRRRR